MRSEDPMVFKNYIFTRILKVHVLADSMEKALKIHESQAYAGELLSCDVISQTGDDLGGTYDEEVEKLLTEHVYASCGPSGGSE